MVEKFNPLVINTPPNDSEALIRKGIDSVVVTTLPRRSEEELKKMVDKLNKEEQEDNEREYNFGGKLEYV